MYPNRLPTNRPNPYTKPGHFDALQQGLPVYEDRQCNASNLIPTVTNVPLQLVNDVVDAVPTAIPIPPIVGGIVQLPPIGLPPMPQVPLTPEQAEALIPDAAAGADPAVRVRRRRGRGRRARLSQAGAVHVRRADARSTRT